jgi:hypothetical protein
MKRETEKEPPIFDNKNNFFDLLISPKGGI